MSKKKKPAVLDITLPTKWGDLTAEQVSRVAYYLSLGLAETEFLVQLAAELADLKPRGMRADGAWLFYHRDRGNVALTEEHVAAIAKALKWTLGEVTPMAAPLLDGYPTPDDALYGILLEQFLTADSACSAYIRLKTPEPLRVLAAALYARGGFVPERLQAEAQRIKYLPAWQLHAVFLWFMGAKQLLAKRFPFVFAGSGDPDAPAAKGSDVLLGLLSSLNEGRVVDNERLKRIDVYEAFHELNLKIKNTKNV